MEELISIIVPVYKAENTIRRCLDSILNQTYGNIEVIAVDDGSPDECPAILDEYALRDRRVKVLHQTNAGVSAARNAGIAAAAGAYISFADSDDRLEPEACEFLHIMLLSEKADVAVGSFAFGDNPPLLTDEVRVLSSTEARIEMHRGVLFEGHVWGKLFKRELFADVSFPEDIYICEDMVTTDALFALADRIAYTPAGLYHYYVYPYSALHRPPTEKDWSVQKAADIMRGRMESVSAEGLALAKKTSVSQDLVFAMRLDLYGMLTRENYSKVRKHMRGALSPETFSLCAKGVRIRLAAFQIGRRAFGACNRIIRKRSRKRTN